MRVLADGVSGGAVGFLVVLALVVAAVLLFRSMLRHLRKVPSSFEPPPAPPQPRQPRQPEAPPAQDDQSSGA